MGLSCIRPGKGRDEKQGRPSGQHHYFLQSRISEQRVFFNVLSQFIYSGTFTLVNIDRNEDGSVAERLLVKRAVGFPEEVVRFHEGNVKIRKAGSTAFEDEISFRTEKRSFPRSVQVP